MDKRKALYLQNIPCGVWVDGKWLVVIFESTCEECGICWFDRKNGKMKERILFSVDERLGNRYIKYLSRKKYADKSYLFYEDNVLVPDRNAKAFDIKNGCDYGIIHSREDLRAYIPDDTFDWGMDNKPDLTYQNMVVYMAHVRGFTAHASSKVAHPGTFAGMQEKIPYLRLLGINTLELQPVYEFMEYPLKEETEESFPGYDIKGKLSGLNYWGYKEGYYFTPKHAYSASDDAVTEFKELVKAFHQNGMAVILQFYFPEEVRRGDICQILQYWVTEYHVDGFHLKGKALPIKLIAESAVLKDIKFWCENPQEALSSCKTGSGMNGVWAGYHSDYMYALRRFLKGDGDSLRGMLYQMRHVPTFWGKINYLSNYFGMTMMDMVSFDEKHNEANGEENRDGIPENHSHSWGWEGTDAPVEIIMLRKRQIKNALVLLFFSQAVPLLFMGDEFGNSQQGNNNPYCLDNDVTWLNWKDLKENEDLFLWVQSLIMLRKDKQMTVLSYHCEQSLQTDLVQNNRHIGMLYCAKEVYYYLAVNMDVNPQILTLPEVLSASSSSGGAEAVTRPEWELVLQTGVAPEYDTDMKICRLEAYSICLFECKKK